MSPSSLQERRGWDGENWPFISQKCPYKVTLMYILRDLHLFNLQHLCRSRKIAPEWMAGRELHAIWTQRKNHFVKLYNESLHIITSSAAHYKIINHTESFPFYSFAWKLIIKASAIPDQNEGTACFHWGTETRDMMSEPPKSSLHTHLWNRKIWVICTFLHLKKRWKLGEMYHGFQMPSITIKTFREPFALCFINM